MRRRNDIRALKAHASAVRTPKPPYTSYAAMLFLGYRDQPVVMEITPAYARLEEKTFAEIAGLAGDVRFIFMMRDPVSRLISGIRHHQRVQSGPNKVNTETVEGQMRRVLAQSSHPILERSQYDKTIHRLESVVPQGQIFYTFYETFFDQTELDRLCDFLGVRHHAGETDKKVFEGSDRTGHLNADLLKEALKTLRPVYDFVEQRFGKTPDAWQNARGT